MEGLLGQGPLVWHPQSGPWEAGQSCRQRASSWSGPSSLASPGHHPIYPPPTAAPAPQGWVGTGGLSHFGEQGGGWAPPSRARAPLGTPYWLAFGLKKGRKEAAGRPCPAPRPQAGGTGRRGGTPAPGHQTGCRGSQSPRVATRSHARQPAPAGLSLSLILRPSGPPEWGWGPGSVTASMALVPRAAPSVWGLFPTVTVRISCTAAAEPPQPSLAGAESPPLTRTPQDPAGGTGHGCVLPAPPPTPQPARRKTGRAGPSDCRGRDAQLGRKQTAHTPPGCPVRRHRRPAGEWPCVEERPPRSPDSQVVPGASAPLFLLTL